MPRFPAVRVLVACASLLPLPLFAADLPDVDPDREVERISLEEYDRRAAMSPDQLPLGATVGAELPAFAPPPLSWTFVGPRPITFEYWSGNANAAGRVSALLPHPTDANTVYLAAAQGGVWKSTDGGATWTPKSDNLSSLASGALAFDPANPGIVYYGTGEQHFSGDSFYGDGLFRSLDGGNTWTKLATKATVGSYIARVALKPTDGNVIYVASDRGVVRTTNAGGFWSVTLTGGYCTDLAVDPATPATAYAAIQTLGIYKSTNDGAGWTLLGGGLPVTGFDRINFALAPSNPLVLYASFVAYNGSLYGMYRSSDGGTSWTLLASTPNYLGGQGWYDNVVIASPANADVCYAGGVFPYGGGPGGVIKTTDAGATWDNITIGSNGSQLHPDQHCMAFGADGGLWVGNDGGVWKSTNAGDTWVNRNADLELTQLYTLALHPTSASFLLGGTQDNGTVRYQGGIGWPQLSAGDGGPAAVEWDSPNIYYSTYVFLNPLSKWTNGVYTGDVTGPWGSDRVNWCNAPLVIDPNQPNTLLAGTHRVWRTTNSGAGWAAISGDLTGGVGHLRGLAVADGSSQTIYSSSSNGRVYLTTTDGANWSPRYAGLPPAALPDVWASPADWQDAFVCADQAGGGRVYRSTDAGLTWLDATGNLTAGVRGLSLAVAFTADPPGLYLGTDFGLYASRDGGTTWAKESSGLPNCAVYDVAVDPVNNYILAATHGRGQWRAVLDQTGPAATLTAPAGGEGWVVGTAHDVTWSATDAGGVDSVRLLLSTDGGASYPTVIASGIPNTGMYTWTIPGPPATTCRVKVVAYDASRNTGADASDADFSMADPALVGVEAASVEAVVLRPLAPNPAHAPLRVAFELPAQAEVRLEVFDALGRRVRELASGLHPAGAHVLAWDGRDARGRLAGSGLFLVRLRAGGVERVRRVVLLTPV